MGKVVILDENTSNKIAAGEVVDRPSSLVKELVENSIDAGAKNISIEIKNGGIKLIKVVDDGSGIEEDDVEIAFERHSTSKIRNADDLESIITMGFRGEALASIAAVSTVELKSKTSKNSYGRFIKIRGGRVEKNEKCGCQTGTSIAVSELFYNTPARFKFLKKDSTEEGYISDILTKIALSHPNIAIKFTSNNKNLIRTPGNNDLSSTIYSIYGKEISNGLCKLDYKDELTEITGFAGKPKISRSNRNQQSIFVNNRYFKSKLVFSAVDQAYSGLLMKNKYAFLVMNIKINPLYVDVNVHPSKIEVKFSDEQLIFRSVFHAIENALKQSSLILEVSLTQKDIFKFGTESINKKSQEQIKITLNEEQEIVSEKKGTENKQEIPVEELKKEFNEKTKEQVETDIKDTTEVQRDVEETEKIEAKNLIKDARIIGQAFSTYVLLESADNLVLIDQHAAHERIVFEQLKKKYQNGETFSQTLISPEVVELTKKEIEYIKDKKDFFEKIGFSFEEFGSNSIVLREVPFEKTTTNAKDNFIEVLDTAINEDNKDTENTPDNILYTVACKAAVKANKHLDDAEIKNLLLELSKIDNPYTCPHGRPTIVAITKYETEKMFKRIV